MDEDDDNETLHDLQNAFPYLNIAYGVMLGAIFGCFPVDSFRQ